MGAAFGMKPSLALTLDLVCRAPQGAQQPAGCLTEGYVAASGENRPTETAVHVGPRLAVCVQDHAAATAHAAHMQLQACLLEALTSAACFCQPTCVHQAVELGAGLQLLCCMQAAAVLR